MKWIKKGLIYCPDGKYFWNKKSYAQVPTAMLISNDVIRIYYCSRDLNNRSYSSYIEVDASNPKNIIYIHNEPILKLGNPGCFDDSGIMPSWVVKFKNEIYFYYVGWNKGITARYRVALGLAISSDNGNSFSKVSTGPILDRSLIDPISVSCNSILIENRVWRMWYMSYTKWEKFKNNIEPFYIIKYAESSDGINWKPKNIDCIELLSKDEGGIARPFVMKEKNIYKMFYSYRGKKDYRKNKSQSYRIGYAESQDGIKWVRKDDEVGIDISTDGWDSEMIEYPFVMPLGNKLIMFYNGNGFGKTGFGYAVLQK